MSGYYEESISILSKAIEGNLPNSVKSRVLIALTLASESLGKTDDALKYGRACIGLDRHSGDALQARSVILGIESTGHPKRRERLLRLAREADRRGVHTIASNIRLLCMNEANTEDEKLEFARQVLEDASVNSDDQYNAMRAMLQICEISVSKGTRLGDSDLARVIDAYHYLLNESMDGLFGLAHRVLWKHFVLAGDAANLLSLFRHSSFKWHLRGKSTEDRKYTAEAVGFLENKLRGGIIRSTREIAYLVLRSGHSLKLLNG